MGSLLLAAGTFTTEIGEKGTRVVLPNARVMIHQPSGGAQGQASGTILDDCRYRYTSEGDTEDA